MVSSALPKLPDVHSTFLSTNKTDVCGWKLGEPHLGEDFSHPNDDIPLVTF